MSLEARIELLTAAVIELTAAIGGMQAPAPGQDSILRELKSAPVTTAAPLEEVAKEAERIGNSIRIEDLPNEPSPTTTSISQTSAEESKPVAYSDVSKLVTSIAKTDLAKAKAALARLGVKHGKELLEADWPRAVEYLTRVANGLDPEASHE
jgi:hypothetical protein